MRPKATRIRRASALAVWLSVVLSACGGGGGGSNASPPSTPPPSTPPPTTLPPNFPQPLPPISAPSYPALELTPANAAEAAAIALRVLERAPPAAALAAFMADLVMQAGPTGTGRCAAFPGGLPTSTPLIVAFDVDGNRTIGPGDVLTMDYLPCSATAASVVFRISVADVATQHLEGRVEFRMQGPNDADAEGSFDLVSTFAGAQRVQTLSGLAIVARENAQADYVTAARIEVGAEGIREPYSYLFDGAVASERLGRSYRFTTPAALRGNPYTAPSEGAIVLESPPGIARITPAIDPDDRIDLADLVVDAAGSGQAGEPTLLPWARVTTGNLFGWHPNTRPRITRLEISPPNPTRLDELVPVYEGFDYDGDSISFSARWERNGASFGFLPTLPPGNFVRGDTIDLTLQAQDPSGAFMRRTLTFTIANAAPVATATITPTAPLSIQDLALAWTGTDADGDPLSATYSWRIDGTAVPGQTAPTLSEAVHAKNQVVTGIANVSDGFTTTEAEASVTILDTPGVVAVPAPPAAIDYDETVSFTAVASDYDGDDTSAHDFRIAYGPAGMTVHPRTGEVSWRAHGPMFEPSLRIAYGVGIDEPGSSVATGSFVVTRPHHVPPLARGAVGPPGALRVGDFDADGDLETLAATDSGIYELDFVAGTGYVQTWADFTSPGGSDLLTGIVAADVDSKPGAEIFVAGANRTLVQYSGSDRSLARRRELPVPETYICADLDIADLDGNGRDELVCLASDFAMVQRSATGVIVVLDAETLEVIAQLPPDVYGGYLAIANVDDDAALEIAAGAGQVFDGAAILAGHRLPEWRHSEPFGWPIAAGDVDGDGTAEIVGIDGVEPIGGLEGTVNVFDGRTRELRWSVASANPGRLHVADVTGDSIAEILVGHDLIGTVTAFQQSSPTSGAPLFAVELGVNAGVETLATGDFDADGIVEIMAAGTSDAWFAVAHASPTPGIEWTHDDPSTTAPSGPFAGGAALGNELVFLTGAVGSGNALLTRFDPTTGDLAPSGEIGAAGDIGSTFVVGDYDDDGAGEALVALDANPDTQVVAYDLEAATVEWSSDGATGEFGPADAALGDFTGDGRDEVVVLTALGGLRVYDQTGSLLYERSSSSFVTSREVAVAELDGGGTPEIVATIDGRIATFVRTATGFEPLATSLQFPGIRAMEIADVDGDGTSEIFVLYGDEPARARLARLDGSLLLRGDVELRRNATDVTTERSGYARKNLLFVNSDFMSDVFAADPATGEEIWRTPLFFGGIPADSVRYHDLGGNGELSLSVGSAAGVTLTR